MQEEAALSRSLQRYRKLRRAVPRRRVTCARAARGFRDLRKIRTSGYVPPRNELARFLTIGPTLVHAYFSITFSIQYPERGTRRRSEEAGGGGRRRRRRRKERRRRRRVERQTEIRTLAALQNPPRCSSLSSPSYLADPFPLPSRIDLLLFLCLRSSRRAEQAGCISVGGGPGVGGEKWGWWSQLQRLRTVFGTRKGERGCYRPGTKGEGNEAR